VLIRFDKEIHALEVNLNGIEVYSIAVEETAGGVGIITIIPPHQDEVEG